MLHVLDLTKAFATRRADRVLAIDHVSLRVEPGEFFTLLGPSGCGKTTTLRCVAGLETPDSGEIRLGGEVVFSGASGRTVRTNHRDIAMVFQSYAIWPHMTVFDNVAFPLQAARLPRRQIAPKVEHALAMVGLAEVAQRSATQLSGGQQQRVALARAVVRDAKVLLLDEPLSNLDAKLRIQMRAELRELQQRVNTTTIYVTHDQDEALSLSDRVAVLRAGTIVEIGTPQQLYLRPRNVFTAQFVGQADLLPAEVRAERGGVLEISTPIGEFVSTAYEPGLRGKVAALMRPEHFEVVDEPPAGAAAANTVRARVTGVTFTGKLVDAEVETAGQRLRIQTISTLALRPGDALWLRVAPERCIVLRDDAPPAAAQELVEDVAAPAAEGVPAAPPL